MSCSPKLTHLLAPWHCQALASLLALDSEGTFMCLSAELTWVSTQVVCDRNQVLVSRTKTKVRFLYRGYRSRIFFLILKLSFFKIQILSCFLLLWGYKFIKSWNGTKIFKTNLKILNIWQAHLVYGTLLWLKKYLILLVTTFFLWNVISVLVTVLAESIRQFGFWFRYQTWIFFVLKLQTSEPSKKY